MTPTPDPVAIGQVIAAEVGRRLVDCPDDDIAERWRRNGCRFTATGRTVGVLAIVEWRLHFRGGATTGAVTVYPDGSCRIGASIVHTVTAAATTVAAHVVSNLPY